MDDITILYECEECFTSGFLLLKNADEDILEVMHCPSCGIELSNDNFEVNK